MYVKIGLTAHQRINCNMTVKIRACNDSRVPWTPNNVKIPLIGLGNL